MKNVKVTITVSQDRFANQSVKWYTIKRISNSTNFIIGSHLNDIQIDRMIEDGVNVNISGMTK